MGLAADAPPFLKMFNNAAPPPPSRFILKSHPKPLLLLDTPLFAQALYHHFGRDLEQGQYGPFPGAMDGGGFDGGWGDLRLRPDVVGGMSDDDWFQSSGQDGLMVS